MPLQELKLQIVNESKRVLKSQVPVTQSVRSEIEQNLISLFTRLTTESHGLYRLASDQKNCSRRHS